MKIRNTIEDEYPVQAYEGQNYAASDGQGNVTIIKLYHEDETGVHEAWGAVYVGNTIALYGHSYIMCKETTRGK